MQIGSYITIGLLIGAVISVIIKDFLAKVFTTITKPIRKKEYGLRCEEISFSANTITIPVADGEDVDFIKSLSHQRIDADDLKNVLIPKKYVFVDTVIQITNTGEKDIMKNDVSKPITIKVPKPFTIANYKPTPSNSQLVVTNTFVDEKKRDTFTSSWNLLKAGDYYNINIIAIAPEEDTNQEQIDSFFDSLDISIYAKNIDKIRKSQNRKDQDKLGLRFAFFVTLLIFGILLLNESKYQEELTPICNTIELKNTDTIKQNSLYQNGIIKYDPSIDSINFSNDSVSFNMSLEDFENNTQIKGVKIDRDTVSIIHSHWIQHKVLMIIAVTVIVLSLLISIALLVFNYVRNVK